jgi:membrane-associated protein
MAGVVDSVVSTLDGLPLWGILLGVWLVMAMEVSMFVGVVVPGDVTVLFAASTVTSPGRGVAIVGAVMLGSLTGETVGYLIGHRYGERLRRSRAGRWVGEERWERTRDFLDRRGGRALFGVRFLAALHAVVPLVAGTVRMPYRRFIAWCALGGLVWASLYVVIGAVAGVSYRSLADKLGNASWIVMGVLALAVVGFLAVRKLRGGEGDGDGGAGRAPSEASERRRRSEDDDQLTHVSLLSLPGNELLAIGFRANP